MVNYTPDSQCRMIAYGNKARCVVCMVCVVCVWCVVGVGGWLSFEDVMLRYALVLTESGMDSSAWVAQRNQLH